MITLDTTTRQGRAEDAYRFHGWPAYTVQTGDSLWAISQRYYGAIAPGGGYRHYPRRQSLVNHTHLSRTEAPASRRNARLG